MSEKRTVTDKAALDMLLKAIGKHRRRVLSDVELYELAKRARAGTLNTHDPQAAKVVAMGRAVAAGEHANGPVLPRVPNPEATDA